jgi:RNA polymerase sigma-70 factor, ECF subfamily
MSALAVAVDTGGSSGLVPAQRGPAEPYRAVRLRAATESSTQDTQEEPTEPALLDFLVAEAVAGEPRAKDRLLTAIHPLVLRYCRGRLGRQETVIGSADDIAQEVCLAVVNALPGYTIRGLSFRAFVYGIAAHKVIDAHRAVSRGRTDPVADVPDSVEIDAGPEQRVLHGELSAQLRALLDELPEKQREILVLRIVVGLSAEETAEIVGASPGAVRVAQHRALGKLRKNIPPGLG